MTIHELWHTSESKSEIKTIHVPEPMQEEIVIQSVYSLISTGTERMAACGKIPSEMHQIMRVPNMEGSFSLPIKYGYSLAGKVINGPLEIMNKTVHLMHPHQDFVKGKNLSISLVPEDIPLKISVLASNMETAINILWDSKITAGQRVLICGFGLIGALTSLLVSQIPAVKVIVHETNQARQKVATELGFQLFEPGDSNLAFFDVAINTTSNEDALQLCIDRTLPEATIVEASWYGNIKVNLNLGTWFHSGRKKIISSQVSEIPSHMKPAFTFERRKQVVFEILCNPVFQKLPISEIPFEESPKVFDRLRNGSYNDFCTIIKYSQTLA